MNYSEYVAQLVRAFRQAERITVVSKGRADSPPITGDGNRILLFSPHPDDECLVGALPLRFRREASVRIVNFPISMGSDLMHSERRLRELKAASEYLDFDLYLKGIRKTGKDLVAAIEEALLVNAPSAIFFPHDRDWHPTHIHTNHLVLEGLGRTGKKLCCLLVETEYWHPMIDPPGNLLVESSAKDVADLIAATSLHRGEVERNAYHIRLPAWMMDNARRAEIMTGKGSHVPNLLFATPYRVRLWKAGEALEVLEGGVRILRAENDVREVLDLGL